MNSITVSPPLDQRDLKKLFASVVGEIQGEYQYKINDFTMSILTGNTFTLRSFDYIGLVLVSMIHGSTQKVVYGVAGRGGGLLGSTLGVIQTLEGKLSRGIKRTAEQNNSTITEDSR